MTGTPRRSPVLRRVGWRAACLLAVAWSWIAPAAAALPPPHLSGTEQTFFVRQWPVDDGTPLNSAVGVIRDPGGFLWVATREGLFQFDGSGYHPVFRPADLGPGSLLYTTMLLDRRGRVWVTTNEGTIACVEGSSATVYPAGGDVPALQPMSIAEDADGDIWVSYFPTRDLCRIGDGRAKMVPVEDGGTYDSVVMLQGDPQGRVWFTSGNRLGALSDGRLETMARLEHGISRAAPARHGGVWAAAGGRLWHWPGVGSPRDVAAAPAGEVERIYEDRRGRLWIATRAARVAVVHAFDGREFQSVPIGAPSVASLSGDDENNLWVGSRRTGVIQVRPRTVELMTPLSETPLGIQSVCEDAADGLLSATGAYGQLLHQDGAEWRQLTARDGWHGIVATCVAADPHGGVWVGTSNQGLHLRRNRAFTVFGTEAGVPGQTIRTVMPDARGDVWIGIDRHPLMRLHDGRAEPVPGSPNDVFIVVPADDGIWAASADGRLMHGDATGLSDRTPRLPAPDPIRSLLYTEAGTLWIGYQSGCLGRLAPGSFHLFPPQFGLRDSAISQIAADERGWLWCGTQRGIFRVAAVELDAVAAGKAGGVRGTLCGGGEGWPLLQASGECWPRSLRRRSGELCLPVSTGLAVVVPDRILENPPRPNVQIMSLQVNGRPHPLPESRAAAMGGATPRIDAGTAVRQLGVEFGVVSFTGRDNIRYRYRLQGFADDWVEAGPQQVAYFSQLPPGRYRFHVTACNNENIWNDNGDMLDIVVAARYWETAWFRWLSWLAAGGALGAIAWRESRRRVRVQLERLEREHALDQERERIARDMHDDLGADLANIATLADLVGTSADEATRTRLDEIGGMAENVVRRLEEIVWSINPDNDSVDRFTSFLCRVAQSHLEPAGIAARFEVPADLPDAPLSSPQRHNLLLAAKEALHNAIRHGVPRRITIGVALRGDRLEVTVADDGRGFIPPEHLPAGHGSANMRERMTQVGGTFERRSAPGQGTTVILSMPLRAAPKKFVP
jgi:signal transduction histidine kinase/ligand-binding sensor domain-containing protein